MKGISNRRHHRDRMISRAKRIMRSWGSSDWVKQAACRWANNMKKCSCDMCRNPRWIEGPTIQEQRFDQEDCDDGRK